MSMKCADGIYSTFSMSVNYFREDNAFKIDIAFEIKYHRLRYLIRYQSIYFHALIVS